jgi:hypothetical protein
MPVELNDLEKYGNLEVGITAITVFDSRIIKRLYLLFNYDNE